MRIAPIGLPSRSSGAPIETPPRVLLACLGRGRAVGRLRLGQPQSRGPMGMRCVHTSGYRARNGLRPRTTSPQKPVNDGTVRANQTCSVLDLGDRASLKIELSDCVLGALRLLNRQCGHSGKTGGYF
jgi:hypothetical protein